MEAAVVLFVLLIGLSANGQVAEEETGIQEIPAEELVVEEAPMEKL